LVRYIFANVLTPPRVDHVVFSRVFCVMCLYTVSWEMRDVNVPLSIRARRVCLDLLFVAGMVRSISAPFIVVFLDAVGARIMRDSSELTDLLLLRLPADRPLE